MARTESHAVDVTDRLNRDRRATDRTLRSEREQADRLSAAVVAENVDARLAAVRAQSDAETSTIETADDLPEVVETLAEAAEKLSDAADGLARAAHKLQDVGDSAAVETLHQVAR